MTLRKQSKKYTKKELAEALVFPVELTQKQQAEAATTLKKMRKESQSNLTEDDILTAKVLQFKFQIEEYLSQDHYDAKQSFGYFLKLYVKIQNKKQNHFASEIDIDETELSQLINQHRRPNENVMIRLEIHSNNSIPALIWYRLVEKEKEHELRTNKALRQREKKFVSNRLPVSIA